MTTISYEEVKLGKLGHVHDPKTMRLANFFKADISVPPTFNTDKGRKPFPTNMFGNNSYGDCVIAGRANQQLRFERIEQRRTIAITDEDAISEYKRLTGCVSPGDDKDTGLVMLYAMRDWRNKGWHAAGRNYKIHSYGELTPSNHQQLKQATFLLSGIQFGFNLPTAIQGKKDWLYNGEGGADWQAGSWGGHCVYGHGYTAEGVIIRTWGYDCLVNWAFVDEFCDEAWGIVDNTDPWRIKQTIDIAKLEQELRDIGATVNQ